jgi:nitrite reductase/ring-hydroxylating ferredoxin subunit
MSSLEPQALCNSQDLEEGGLGVSFDVEYQGRTLRAFAVRFEGQVRAYLNRCSHVAMELDMQPDRFFDDQGLYLICASHGATFDPATGQCLAGPSSGGLIPVDISEAEGVVHWHPRFDLKPVHF